jgi:hypothetical protein
MCVTTPIYLLSDVEVEKSDYAELLGLSIVLQRWWSRGVAHGVGSAYGILGSHQATKIRRDAGEKQAYASCALVSS